MSAKFYLWVGGILTICCWLVAVGIFLITDPYQIGIKIFAVFFASLLLALIGSLTLLGYNIRIRLSRREVLYAHLGVSFRQAILISLVIVGLLLLQAARVLNWWDGILLVSAILLLELYFRTK